jgi:hypothetical protein
MAIVKSLKQAKNEIDARASEGPKGRWLKLDDGQKVKLRFVNELSADSKNYNEKLGQAIVVAEHTNPKDYRRKALCSMDDEGRCYGCEQNRKDPKAGWKAKLRFYTNVYVYDNEENYVAIWSQGVGPKSTTTNTISDYDDETGSITNLVWSLRRNGTGTQTNYVLIPGAIDENAFDFSGVEPFDLMKVATRQVAYTDQENFYMGLDVDSSASTSLDW